MKKLDSKAFWLFLPSYTLIAWIVIGGIIYTIYPIFYMNNVAATKSDYMFDFFVWSIILVIVFGLIAGILWAWLTYINWSYEIGEKAIKINKGVIVKHYVSIPYDRIQNVDIVRSLWARILGISNLMIQTAGYSAARQGILAEGVLPALDPKTAEELREKLIKKVGVDSQGL